MNDQLQTKINQLSLVMTIPEDIVKACKANDLSPAFVETMIRMHNQQVELQKSLNETRSIQYQMAQVIDQFSTFSTGLAQQMADMAKHTGFDPEELVSAEKIGQEE